MRRNIIFKAWLAIFFAHSFNISFAQPGKTLHGTVSDQEGYKKTSFNTPNGTINLITTGDQDFFQQGKTLRGTVTVEPAGNKQKEKDKNLSELKKYLLTIGGTSIAITGLRQMFNYSGSPKPATQCNVNLKTPDGSTETVHWSIPKDPVVPITGNTSQGEALFTNQNLLLGDNILTVHTLYNPNLEFKPTDDFVMIDKRGNAFQVTPWAQSPTTTLLKVPSQLEPGGLTVCRYKDGKLAGRVKTYYYDLDLSSPNTNLKSGEQSFVVAKINLPDQSLQETPLPFPFCLDFKNLKPGNVKIDGGNFQRVSLPVNNDFENSSACQAKRIITGLTPGEFAVNVTLNHDNNTSNDPFLPQETVLNTADEYNHWTEALKKDLQNYASHLANDAQGQAMSSNIKRAIENLKTCSDDASLSECKALANHLLLPLHIPKGAATSWLCSVESMKAALTDMNEKISGKENVISWPLLLNGTTCINRIAKKIKDENLQNETNEIIKQINDLNGTDVPDQSLVKINQQLNDVIAKCESKISPELLSYTLNDLLYATYEMVPPKTKDGVHPFRDRIGYINLEKGTLMLIPTYQQQVMSLLNAHAMPDGKWQMLLMTPTKRWVNASVKVVPVNPLKLFENSNGDEGLPLPPKLEKKNDKPVTTDNGDGLPLPNFGKTGAKEKKDSVEDPILVEDFTDSTEVRYILFREAKCELLETGHKSECEEDGYAELNKETGHYEWKTNGRYRKYEFYDMKVCKHGDGFCIEQQVVVGLKYIYQDKKCSVLLKVENIESISCQ